MGSSNHSHDYSDEIVLNQEKVLPYGVIAFVLALITILALAQAGKTKFDYNSGENAYKMIEQDKLSLKNYNFKPNKENKNNNNNEKNKVEHNENHNH
ncbi:MAG: hypothetical protein KatS3mg068_1699 [Candidatus Sericytochromatia bacterium]|nr:MAG: hypothetical protein KatS3mg068_1699 [Candidatus Sericytochromatia bacterium]